jgi:hypothetical protein
MFDIVCRDNVVCIATVCGLDGPGIEPQWGGRGFPHLSRWLWDPPSVLYGGYRTLWISKGTSYEVESKRKDIDQS